MSISLYGPAVAVSQTPVASETRAAYEHAHTWELVIAIVIPSSSLGKHKDLSERLARRPRSQCNKYIWRLARRPNLCVPVLGVLFRI